MNEEINYDSVFWVGEFEITQSLYSKDSFWITNSLSEGMEVKKVRLEALLKAFWEKEF